MPNSTHRTKQLLQWYVKLKMKKNILKDNTETIHQGHLNITSAKQHSKCKQMKNTDLKNHNSFLKLS